MAQPPQLSPFRDGFAALWHEPALMAAELTWRWCFGLAAWGLTIIAAVLFLDSLTISRANQFLLGTLNPRLMQEAVRHIFRGSLARFLAGQTALLIGLTLLWSLAATAGRAGTLRRLVAMFSADDGAQSLTWEFRPVFVLNLLRAVWSLLAFSAVVAFVIAGLLMAGDHRPLRAAVFLSFGAGLAWGFGLLLNWFFGLAPLFCIRSGSTAREALAQSIAFCSRQSGRLFPLGLVFAILRLIWAATMFSAVFAPLPLVRRIAPGWVMLIMAAIALVYFAGADLLYLARLGAYASLAEDDSRPVTPEPAEPAPLPPEVLSSEILPATGRAL